MTPPPEPPRRGRDPRALWALLLLAIAVVAPLLVWTYAREGPTLAGVPFFFWYQFALVPVAAALTFAAYRLVIAVEADRRTSANDGGEPQ